MAPTDDIPRHLDGTPVQLGRYRLIRPISSGGMARVFEGRREGLAGVAPRVAVKVILPEFAADPAFHDLFINEAQIGSLVRHPNLVQIQDFDRAGDRYFLVMEFVEGVTLRRVVGLCRKHGLPIPLSALVEIGRQACEGLSHLHGLRDDQGRLLRMVHRDIKPSNLMLDEQGVVKILDFGVSRALHIPETDRAVRGTWGYMPPEQAGAGEVGPAADLFGLAAILYELAALSPLFPESKPEEVRPLLAADEAARRASRLKSDPTFAPLVPVLVRALQRDPAARFRAASEMGRALSALAPDGIAAREALVRFQHTMAELARPPDAARDARVGPGGSRRPAAPRAAPSDGLPVSAGSRPSPGRPRGRGARAARDARMGKVGAALMVLALLIVAFTAWRLFASPWTPTISPVPPAHADAVAASTPPAPTPTPAPAPAPIAQEAPVSAPVLEEAAEVAIPEAPPEVADARPGRLTIGASLRARVFVDGSFVRDTPLFQHTLPSGSHAVMLVAEDGRRTTFGVQVPSGGEARAVWDFDAGALAGN